MAIDSCQPVLVIRPGDIIALGMLAVAVVLIVGYGISDRLTARRRAKNNPKPVYAQLAWEAYIGYLSAFNRATGFYTWDTLPEEYKQAWETAAIRIHTQMRKDKWGV